MVVEGGAGLCFQGRQSGGECVERKSFEALAQGRILRHVAEVVAAHDALQVESRAAAHHHLTAAGADVVVGREEVLLIAIEVVLHAWFGNVDEVKRHLRPIGQHIIGQVFARAQIHAAVHLPRVGADDFSPETLRQGDGKTRFSTSRRAENGDEHRRGNERR